MTRGPYPDDVAGLLSPEAARAAKKAVKDLRGRDSGRFDVARETFANEEDGR